MYIILKGQYPQINFQASYSSFIFLLLGLEQQVLNLDKSTLAYSQISEIFSLAMIINDKLHKSACGCMCSSFVKSNVLKQTDELPL